MSDVASKIRIGTRASKLARTQSLEVKRLLVAQTILSQDQIEIVPITTSGDKIQDRNLAEIGGKGLFIKELEEALIQNKIDIAIHSAKDVPPFLHEQTHIAAYTKRIDIRDCFISKKYNSLQELPQGAVVGTSSARRKSILLRLRPDLKIVNFRGNVDTRLNKINNDEVDASLLAVCGLERLNKKEVITEIINTNTILPAGGQGSLIIQTRKDDAICAIICQVNDFDSEVCLTSEREFLKELKASCSTPVAVYAYKENNQLHLKTMILDYDGSEIYETSHMGDFSLESGKILAKRAALETKTNAQTLLTRICG